MLSFISVALFSSNTLALYALGKNYVIQFKTLLWEELHHSFVDQEYDSKTVDASKFCLLNFTCDS